MVKILDEKPIPRATVTCKNCGSLLEYGNGDLSEQYEWASTQIATAHYKRWPKYYFRCPVCGCKVGVSWIRSKEE